MFYRDYYIEILHFINNVFLLLCCFSIEHERLMNELWKVIFLRFLVCLFIREGKICRRFHDDLSYIRILQPPNEFPIPSKHLDHRMVDGLKISSHSIVCMKNPKFHIPEKHTQYSMKMKKKKRRNGENVPLFAWHLRWDLYIVFHRMTWVDIHILDHHVSQQSPVQTHTMAGMFATRKIN